MVSAETYKLALDELTSIARTERRTKLADPHSLNPLSQLIFQKTKEDLFDFVNYIHGIHPGRAIPCLFYAWTEDNIFGAWSASGEYADYIVLSCTSVHVIRRVTAHLVRNEFSLDSATKDWTRYHYTRNCTNFSATFNFFDEVYGDAPLEVKGDGDKEILSLIGLGSMMALVHHELAHIWNGHTRFSSHCREKGRELNYIQKLALEFDADMLSVRGLYLWFQKHYVGAYGSEKIVDPIERRAFCCFIIRAFVVLFHILFRSLAEFNPSMSEVRFQDASYRQIWMLNSIVELVRHEYQLEPLDRDILILLIESCLSDVTEITNDIFPTKVDPNFNKLSFDLAAARQKQIAIVWNDLQEQLMSFNRGGLLYPAFEIYLVFQFSSILTKWLIDPNTHEAAILQDRAVAAWHSR